MNKYYIYLVTKQIITINATSYTRSSIEYVFYDSKDQSFAHFKTKFVIGVERVTKENER